MLTAATQKSLSRLKHRRLPAAVREYFQGVRGRTLVVANKAEGGVLSKTMQGAVGRYERGGWAIAAMMIVITWVLSLPQT